MIATIFYVTMEDKSQEHQKIKIVICLFVDRIAKIMFGTNKMEEVSHRQDVINDDGYQLKVDNFFC